jgi:hypothetical protein
MQSLERLKILLHQTGGGATMRSSYFWSRRANWNWHRSRQRPSQSTIAILSRHACPQPRSSATTALAIAAGPRRGPARRLVADSECDNCDFEDDYSATGKFSLAVAMGRFGRCCFTYCSRSFRSKHSKRDNNDDDCDLIPKI